MEQKTYSCMLRFKGGMMHSVPLECVTKHELRLLAFMHGTEAIVELRYIGTKKVADLALQRDDGTEVFVMSEMDEFKRLSRKYDTIVNSGRRSKTVEECFHTRIEDFDSMIAEVSAEESVERAAAEAEAKKDLAAIADIEKERAEKTPATQAVGARVFGGSGTS